MMKKRIALLGLLGCMALCSERVQAVRVSFDGQIYELSDADYKRYETVSRVRKTGDDTQQKADGRVRELLAKLDDQKVKPSVAPTSTVASKTTMAPPVPAAPTPEQIRDAAARRAAAMPATPVHATAASAAAAQPEEHEALSAGEKRALGLAGYGEAQIVGLDRMIRTQGRSAADVQEALGKADIAMRAEYNARSTRGLLNSSDSPMRGPRGFSNTDQDVELARQLQQEEDAELAAAMQASMQQSTSPALSTGSVTPPTVVVEEVVVVRPPDKQFREVMVVQPVGMSDEVWEMVKGGDMTIDEATEYLLVMAQAEREAAEAAANQAAIRSAEVELEDQAVNDLLKAERINLLIEKYQAYAAIRRDLLLGVSEVLDMVATEVALEAAERVALQAAFSETAEAVGLRVLREALAQ